MNVATAGTKQAQVEVRFDVIGWTAEQSAEAEDRVNALKLFLSGAVVEGFDTGEMLEELLDSRLFDAVDLDLERGESGVIVSVVAVAAGQSVMFNYTGLDQDKRYAA